MKHSTDKQSGQAIVILALMMIGLLAFAALAIDGGNAYVERRRSQNGADAGALAGARQIWVQVSVGNGNETTVLAAINQAAEGNGISAGSSIYDNPNVKAYYTDENGVVVNQNQIGTLGFIPPGVGGIQVDASRRFNTFVGGFFSQQSPAASARATAVIVPPIPCNSFAVYGSHDVNVTGCGQDCGITNGGVYAGNDLTCDTSKMSIPEPFTWKHGGDPSQQCVDGEDGNTVVQGSEPTPPAWKFSDFEPGGSVEAALGGDYHIIPNDNSQYTASADGLYFIDGDMGPSKLDLADNVHNITIVANGLIQFSGGINLAPFYNGLLLFSNAPNNAGTSIKISGSNLNWQGLLYAPNGAVDTSGASNVSISGSINAYDISMSGSGININYDPASCVPQRATIKLLK